MRSSHLRLGTPIIVATVVALLAGCASSTTSSPSAISAATAAPSVAVQATDSPEPAAVPSPEPTASPDPSPTPLVAIDPSGTGDWSMLPDSASLGTGIIEEVVAVPDGFVALGCTTQGSGIDCTVPALWTSADALTWSEPILLPTSPNERLGRAKAAAMTPAGLAVGGLVGRGDRVHAALWFSPDGRSFERVAGVRSFANAEVIGMASANGRFVAVGTGSFMEPSGFRAWSSDDGQTWVDRTPIGGDEAFPRGLLAIDGGFVAWGASCGLCVSEAAWWRSRDGRTWSATGELAQAGANVTTVGTIDDGLVAFGTIGGGKEPVLPAAWSRATGAHRWKSAQPPDAPTESVITDYLRVGHGAVLAGRTFVADEWVSLVWLAGPGEDLWRPPIQIPGMSVIALLQDPVQLDRLVVAVASWAEDDRQRVAIWAGTVDWSP